MQILSNHISALNVSESPKFSPLLRNLVRGIRWWRQILDRKWKYGRFAHAQWKLCNIALIYSRIVEIYASLMKSGPRNTLVTSDCRPEVEIWPFCACAMHQAIIIGTARLLWTRVYDRYHAPQNAFLVSVCNQQATQVNSLPSQKTRLNDLSYGIKIWTDFSFVLSQFTRLTDGRTDRHLFRD